MSSPPRPTIRPLILGSFLACVLVSPALAQKGKNAPPPPPPVLYHIKTFGMPTDYGFGPNGNTAISPRDMNNLGQVVGWYSWSGGLKAFLYDPSVDPDRALDLNQLVAAPEGWYLAEGRGINDQGEITGALRRLDGTGGRRGFLIERGEGLPELSLLPDETLPDTAAMDINENGDVLGVFQLADGSYGGYVYNPWLDGPAGRVPFVLPFSLDTDAFYATYLGNPLVGDAGVLRPAQVAGQLADGKAFRYTLGETAPQVFPEIDKSRNDGLVRGLNDFGDFSGRRYVKGKYEGVYHDGITITSLGGSYGAIDINNSRDCFLSEWRLYHHGTGVLNLNDLVKLGSDSDLAIWAASSHFLGVELTERQSIGSDKPGFPVMSGSLYVLSSDTGYGAFLTPRPAP